VQGAPSRAGPPRRRTSSARSCSSGGPFAQNEARRPYAANTLRITIANHVPGEHNPAVPALEIVEVVLLPVYGCLRLCLITKVIKDASQNPNGNHTRFVTLFLMFVVLLFAQINGTRNQSANGFEVPLPRIDRGNGDASCTTI
jgi:hypothetical protein